MSLLINSSFAQAPRPPFTRSISSPSPTLSPEHQPSNAPRVLRKRHSAHALAPPPQSPALAPNRPPRNPARDVPPVSFPRLSTATGALEDVTPWELMPGPDQHTPSTSKTRSSSEAFKEEVTPWELFPVPSDAPPVAVHYLKPARSSRPYTSSHPGKTFSDFTRVRRRKSTGSKQGKLHSTTLPISPAQAPLERMSSGSTDYPIHSPPRPPQIQSSKSESDTGATLSHPSHFSALPAAPPATLPEAKLPQQDLRFSTADRTILRELKRSIDARAAQFVIKGAGVGAGVGGIKPGRKHHPYPPKEVPYPRNFEREVVDLDVWETVFCQDICESVTWHVFESPPTKVLDIGCGTGTWVLNCARTWKDCHFVGLDLVPLQPDLQQVGSSDLASRVTWVHSNFLEGLPFPNDEFDFVHIKRISLGVPEDQWDALLEEITRVMKPGGAFEMLEEDLFFPGKPPYDDTDSEMESDFERPLSPDHQDVSIDHERTVDTDSTSVATHSAESHKSGNDTPETPTTSTSAIVQTPSRSNSPYPLHEEAIEEDEKFSADNSILRLHMARNRDIGRARSPSHPLMPVKGYSSSHGLSKLKLSASSRQHMDMFTISTTSLLSSVGGVLPPPPAEGMHVREKPRRYSSATASSTNSLGANLRSNQSPPPMPPLSVPQPKLASKFSPFLLRTLPKKPANPRDHSVLEKIYTEMLGSRFINLAPLSLLESYLYTHFKDVRTHQPILYSFPPQTTVSRTNDHSSLSDSDNDFDSDDARDAIVPRPSRQDLKKARSIPASPARSIHSEDWSEFPEEKRWLSLQGLMHNASEYIHLDDTRVLAYSPFTKSTFAVPNGSNIRAAGAKNISGRRSRLPNKTLNIDLRTLNMHLALRTAEVLGCADSMWEWVVEYQEEVKSRRKIKLGQTNRPSRPGSSEHTSPRQSRSSLFSSPRWTSTDSTEDTIVDLTREDFDSLLSRFDMDMRQQMSLGPALNDRFSWSTFSSSPTTDQKTFDAACEKWEQWEQDQQRRPSSSHPYQSPPRRHAGATSVSTASTLPVSPMESSHDDQPDGRHVKRKASHATNETYISVDATPRRHYFVPPSSSFTQSQFSPSSSSRATQMPPARRLSRAMRIFVAWKA